MIYQALLALTAGAAIAIQAGLNARLGVLLDNALYASAAAFFFSFLFICVVLVSTTGLSFNAETLKGIPFYLWFAGASLSAYGVGMMYHLIPQAGVGTVMSYALTGQLVTAMLISHFGLFQLPADPVSGVKIVGIVSLIIGVTLINLDVNFS